MTEDATETVLQRKAHAQRRALGGGAWSLPRALGRALSIAADALWGLTLVARTTDDETLSAERAASRIGGDRLLVILEHDSGPRGLVAFDREILTGLIDVQTLGRVTRFPSDARAYTPTDAAMTAPLVDAALPRFASMLSAQPDMAHLQNYRFGALVEDAQAASLALDAETYHLTALDVSLAQDMRSGRVLFLFPEPPRATDTGKAALPGRHEAVLKLAPVRMQAVLARIHISLDRAQGLRPGDVLPISSRAASSASLVLSGGHVVARGKLGQMNGFRAIRVGAGDTALHTPDQRAAQPEAPQSSTALVPIPSGKSAFDHGGSLEMALSDISASLPVVSDAFEL